MNSWLDLSLVIAAVIVSAVYAVYALGPKRIRDAYTRLATKYFGLRALRWFAANNNASSCRDCSANPNAPPSIGTSRDKRV